MFQQLKRKQLFCTIPFTRKKYQKEIKINNINKLYFNVNTTLTTINQIFQPLIQFNNNMKIIQNENILEINNQIKGNFIFKIDINKKQLEVISPYSGLLVYYYCDENGLWLGTQDKHDMRGLITRDWLRGFIGCPSFD